MIGDARPRDGRPLACDRSAYVPAATGEAMIGTTHRKGYVTRQIIAECDGYFECRDTWRDGYTRIVRPLRWQMERWLIGAEVAG